MSKKPEIRFTVSDEEKKAELEEYAQVKGFNNVGALARFALYQYLGRYPLKKHAEGKDSAE